VEGTKHGTVQGGLDVCTRFFTSGFLPLFCLLDPLFWLYFFFFYFFFSNLFFFLFFFYSLFFFFSFYFSFFFSFYFFFFFVFFFLRVKRFFVGRWRSFCRSNFLDPPGVTVCHCSSGHRFTGCLVQFGFCVFFSVLIVTVIFLCFPSFHSNSRETALLLIFSFLPQ